MRRVRNKVSLQKQLLVSHNVMKIRFFEVKLITLNIVYNTQDSSSVLKNVILDILDLYFLTHFLHILSMQHPFVLLRAF